MPWIALLTALLCGCGGGSSGGARPTVGTSTETPRSTDTPTPAVNPTRTATPPSDPSATDTPLATATLTPTPSPSATATLDLARACADLSDVDLPEISIATAAVIAAGSTAPLGLFPAPGALPAHCLVQGEIAPRTGADGKRYAIGFEMRLPDPWSGRFLFQGGAGTDGDVIPAIGPIPLSGNTVAPALARGYVVVSTDAGHQGFEADFGLDPQARADYFYNALDRTTVVAKAITARFYGRPPERSYILGCSNGGRQALLAAQRFPNHFDGAVAGNPGFNLSNAVIAILWDTIAFNAIAPRAGDGLPILSRALSDADLGVLGNAVLLACDGNDGLVDGLIDDLEGCDFDPAVVECPGEKTDGCLSAEQVGAIRKVFGGPKTSSGEALYSDWPYDSGIGNLGWRAWKLGTSRTSMPDSLGVRLGFGTVHDVLFTPPEPDFDPLAFDFDTDPARTAESAALLNATSTDMSAFRARGGKLLVYQGNSDPVYSTNDVIRYYREVVTDNGGAQATREWARLFLVPGMDHCGSGPALDDFDPLSALEDWVEKGIAPDRLVATGSAFPGRSRPLCPYPEQSRYTGSGDPEDAASFACVEPTAATPSDTRTPTSSATPDATAPATADPSATATPLVIATSTATPSPTATLDLARACADLSGVDLPETSIATAQAIAAGGTAPLGFFPASGTLPAHCLVSGEIAPRTGADGKRYAIGFEVRLPVPWSGRFLFQGGGGTDGILAPAVGPIPLFANTASPALARGYAVVATDAGHQGFDSAFGLDPQARVDFFYNALDRTTVIAKEIAARFYGRPPEHSYILGCSNGGRQALLAAQRFPDHFDGAVAGNPAFNLSNAAIAQLWDTIAFNAIAPRDGSGLPILSRALSDADLKVLNDAVLLACDGDDGLVDGSIDDLEGCDFDPAVVECTGEKIDGCLSAEQVGAIRKVFGGPKTSSGAALYSDWPYDGGIASPGWRTWKLGTSPTSTPDSLDVRIGFGAMRYILLTPPDPDFDPLAFDFDTDPARTVETGAQLDATSTDMSAFRARGGKLLLYQGNSDAVFSANDLIRYYREVGEENGGAGATRAWARLFLVPGMNHCGTGKALDDFDPLTAIEDWVERGIGPDRLVARGAAFPGRSRPLCPYPEQSRYTGSGDTDDAASFACAESDSRSVR